MRDTIVPALRLFVVALVAALLLGVVHYVTRDPIARYAEEKARAARLAVVPDAVSFQASSEDEALYLGYDASGALAGYALTVKAKGYGGAMTVMVGLSADGKILGVRVNAHNETEGLGSRCAGEGWLSRFVGLSGSARLRADGGQVDAVSGATISSRAVTGAVDTALAYYEEHLGGGRAGS